MRDEEAAVVTGAGSGLVVPAVCTQRPLSPEFYRQPTRLFVSARAVGPSVAVPAVLACISRCTRGRPID